MNYLKIYNNLIERARNRTIDGYVEKHHIIPKCMGGSNEKSNLVALTPEEHFLAHLLLVKIHPEEKNLIFAATMMTKSNTKQRRNNKVYGWVKKLEAQRSSELNSGRNGWLGKKHSEETKRKLSELMKGRKPWNYGIPNPKSAENARKGSEKMKETIKGRKIKVLEDGRRVWEYPNKKTSS